MPAYVAGAAPGAGRWASLRCGGCDVMSSGRLPTYLSVDQAASMMSLSVKTIRRRIADGTTPA